jgi:beta-phosphoglucomutase
MSFKGAIFDLDGVIVNTVPLHFKAWRRMFGEYRKNFSFQDYKSKVDGIPRLDGARAILTDLSDEEIEKACEKKQRYYLEYLETEGIEVYGSSVSLIEELRNNHIKIAIISSSKNCPHILRKAALYRLIDVEVNGNDITKGKPDPEIFIIARNKLGLKEKECIVFEDAGLGVEAAKRADIFTVGIDRHNDPERLKRADLIVKDLGELNYNKLKTLV